MKTDRPTIHDIARELNITASTVSRALSNHPRISEATRNAVIAVARRLNYQPHRIATALRNGKSRIIGVIIPMANRNFFGSLVRGIEEVANTANYQVMICQSYEDPAKEAAAVEALLNSGVDGILASVSKRVVDLDHFRRVKEKGIPLVLFDRLFESLQVSHVVIDDYQAAYEAVTHLIDQGCRRIAHFTNVQKISIYLDRYRGYHQALLDHHLDPDPAVVIESDLQLEDGRRSMEQLLQLPELPDAVFSASDLGAMGALQVLKEKNIPVPEAVALVGFSNDPFTMFSDPPLTSVDQHCLRMGNLASELFLEEVKNPSQRVEPRKIVIKPDLIIRKSSLRKK